MAFILGNSMSAVVVDPVKATADIVEFAYTSPLADNCS
jgi:hypothetical protein